MLLTQQEGPLLRVTITNPGKRNAMSRAMWRELRAVFERIQRRDDVRCVLVQGEGGHFCAGGDIAEYPAFRFNEATLREFHEGDVWGGLSAMLACDVPIIALIKGACMGAGMEIASCCDLRIAAASASFGAPIAKLGFPMAPREAALVARAAGELTAREMLLAAAVLSAPVMLARGFLNHVVADDQVTSEAHANALRIASLAPQAARLNKQVFRNLQASNTNNAPEKYKKYASETIANDWPDGVYSFAASAEHREGISAFLAKRKPEF
jgi:enoyl-CoA hydratase/carnithine racemase